ncbi:MAG: hypothetical protein A2169_13810 [Deltaproteobacteria bacterium RBG_13_47_9]|nr:MAG: hypothetical protein A2169_13810 [Deltaproteobacteria bacterium RBG_13_47_9]
MKKIGLLGILFLFLFLPASILAQGEASRYLEVLEKKYSGLKDYIVDINVHFDIETFKAPDVQARLYYKAPDKMKLESKRVLFFPREGGYFNPSLFKKEDFIVIVLEHLTDGGRKAVKLRLIPRKTKRNAQDFVLTIDTEQNLVKEVNVVQSGGREIKAEIAYGVFGQFELPARIRLLLDFPAVEPEMMKGFEPSGQGTKRVTGKIEITYSNYRVNSGLSDEIFKETEPQRP